MGNISSLDNLIALAAGTGVPGSDFIYKDAISITFVGTASAAPTAPIVGRWHDLWLRTGIPSSGTIQGNASASVIVADSPDNTSYGAIPFENAPTGTQKWLTGMSASTNTGSVLLLYDRLVQAYGFNGTVTTAQSVPANTGTITRNMSGTNNRLFADIYTTVGATSVLITGTYTNELGTPFRVTSPQAFGNTGFKEDGRLMPLPLQAGDTGVTSVQSVQLSATTALSGGFGVIIMNPLLLIDCSSVGPGGYADLISQSPSPVEIENGACLCLAQEAMSTTQIQVVGHIDYVHA